VAAHEATRAAAGQNLALGWDVVVDAVNDTEPARRTWHCAAERTEVALRFVLLTCSDQQEHRRRLESRQRGLHHLPEPTWSQVESAAVTFEPWTDHHELIDTSAPLERGAGNSRPVSTATASSFLNAGTRPDGQRGRNGLSV